MAQDSFQELEQVVNKYLPDSHSGPNGNGELLGTYGHTPPQEMSGTHQYGKASSSGRTNGSSFGSQLRRVHPVNEFQPPAEADDDEDAPLGGIIVAKSSVTRLPSNRSEPAVPNKYSPPFSGSMKKTFSSMSIDEQKILYGFQPANHFSKQLSEKAKKHMRDQMRNDTLKKLLNTEGSTGDLTTKSSFSYSKGRTSATSSPRRSPRRQGEQEVAEREHVPPSQDVLRNNERMPQNTKATTKPIKAVAHAVAFAQFVDTEKNRHQAAAQGGAGPAPAPEELPWYMRTIDKNSMYMNSVALASVFAAVLDIFIMFIEGTSFFDWRYRQDTKEALSRGDIFDLPNKDPDSRSYISKTFQFIKVAFGLMSDLIYILDMSCKFRLVERKHFDIVVEDVPTAAKKYFHSYFARDLFASLPIYWIFIPIPWVRCNRFIRLYSAPKDLRPLVQFFSNYMNPQLIRIIFIAVAIIITTHVVACCTVMVVWGTSETASAWFGIDDDGHWSENWGGAYLQSALYAWNLVMSGMGRDWTPQTPTQAAWQLSVSVVGSLVYMYVFAQLIGIQHNYNQSAAEFRNRREMITSFLRIREVPKSMLLRVSAYFDALWTRKNGMEEREVLDSLPSFLRHDVMWQLNKAFINKVPMFHGAEATELLMLNQSLVHMVVTPGEFIVRRGELAESVYFLIDGTLQIFDHEEYLIAELFEGSVVGEVAMMLDAPHTFDAMASTSCDMLALNASDFHRLGAIFPEFIARLEKRANILYGPYWRDISAIINGIPRESGPSCLPTLNRESSDESDLQSPAAMSRDTSYSMSPSLPQQLSDHSKVPDFPHSAASNAHQRRSPHASSNDAHTTGNTPGARSQSPGHKSLLDDPARRPRMGRDSQERTEMMRKINAMKGSSGDRSMNAGVGTKSNFSRSANFRMGSGDSVAISQMMAEMIKFRSKQDSMEGRMKDLTGSVQECLGRLERMESLLTTIAAQHHKPS